MPPIVFFDPIGLSFAFDLAVNGRFMARQLP